MNNLEELVVSIVAKVDQAVKDIKKVEEAIVKVETTTKASMGKVQRETQKVNRGFSGVSKAIIAAFSIRAITSFFRKYLELTKQTEKFREQMALAFQPFITAVQPLMDALIRTISQGVAFLTGLLLGLFPSLKEGSNDSTSTIIANNKAIAKSYQGFDELNVIPSQATGSATTTPTIKPLFSQEEINKAIAEGKEFADKFKDEIKLLTTAILGLTAAIAGFKIFNTLAGIFTGFGNLLLWLLGLFTAAKLGIGFIIDAFKGFGVAVAVNGKAVNPFLVLIQRIFAWLGETMRLIVAWVVDSIPAFTKGLSSVVNVISNIIKFFLTLKGIILLFIAAVVAAFVYMYNKSKEFKDKVDAVIAEFGVVFSDFYDEYLKEFVEYFIQVYEDIKKALEPAFKWISDRFNELKTFILAFVAIVKLKFDEFVTFLKDLFSGTVEFLAYIGLYVLEVFLEMFKGVLKVLGGVIDFFKGIFTLNMEKAVAGLDKVLWGIVDIITSPFKVAFNWVVDLWNNTIGKLSWKVPDWVPLIGGSSISAPKLTKWNGAIPKLAEGGMLNAGQLFIAGEAGAEMVGTHKGKTTVMPLENTDFVGAIKQAVVEGMAIASQGSNGSITMNVDGMVLAKAVEKNLNKLSTLQGGLNIAL